MRGRPISFALSAVALALGPLGVATVRARAASDTSGCAPQSGAALGPFDEIPHVRTRSGFLLVRPVQESGWIARGHSPEASKTRTFAARARLDPWRARTLEFADIHCLAVPDGLTDEAFASSLLATGDYEYAEPDWLVHPMSGGAGDPALAEQWQLFRMRAPDAWVYETGDPVVCAFVDTGVDLNHPDLAGALVPGCNVVFGAATPQTSGGLVQDVNGHGTSTAGAAAAIGDNGVGGCGVGWDFRIMPIRATNSAGGSILLSDALLGASWAAHQGAKVVSVSVGGVSNQSVENTGAYVRSRGAILVWAAENVAVEYSTFDHPSVVIVNATTQNDTLAPNCAFGRAIDIAAPGVGVYVPVVGGGYASRTGASFAAPLVAGTMALVWSARPDLTPDQVVALALANADDIGPPGEDNVFGHGRVNAFRAVAAAVWGDGGTSTAAATATGGVRRPEFLPAANTCGSAAGLRARMFDVPGADRLPPFEDLAPAWCGAVGQIEVPKGVGHFGSGAPPGAAATFDGFITVPASTVYTFTLLSSDGSALYVDERLVVDNDWVHPMTARTGRIGLEAGPHTFRVEFFSCQNEAAGLTVRIQGAAMPDQVIPASMLTFNPTPADINADGRVDGEDYAEYFRLLERGDMRADFDGDGKITPFDLVAFLDAYYNAEPC